MKMKQRRLANKVAIITGATEGKGVVEAKYFAEEGATVLITDIPECDINLDKSVVCKEGVGYLIQDVSSKFGWSVVAKKVEKVFRSIKRGKGNGRDPDAQKKSLKANFHRLKLKFGIPISEGLLSGKGLVRYIKKVTGGTIITVSSLQKFSKPIKDVSESVESKGLNRCIDDKMRWVMAPLGGLAVLKIVYHSKLA